MAESATGQIIQGLWRFEALLPDWTEHEGGEDGWEQQVAWWAIATPHRLVLIDPSVDDWSALDQLVAERGDSRRRAHSLPGIWTQPEGGPARLRALLSALTVLPIEHVLVSHGPLVMGAAGIPADCHELTPFRQPEHSGGRLLHVLFRG